MMNPMWGWDGGGWGMGWGVFGLMHLLWVVLLVVVVAAIFRALLGDRGGMRRDSALDILRERYARGEIDHAEYEERRKKLKG